MCVLTKISLFHWQNCFHPCYKYKIRLTNLCKTKQNTVYKFSYQFIIIIIIIITIIQSSNFSGLPTCASCVLHDILHSNCKLHL